MFYGQIVIVAILIKFIYTQLCEERLTCNECVASDSKCLWCLDVEYKSKRCSLQENLLGCMNIYDPPDFSQTSSGEITAENFYRAFPATYRLENLQEGVKKTAKFTIESINYIPTEIFLLLDVSQSMEVYVEQLRSRISELISLVTQDGRQSAIGVGGFLDTKRYPTGSNGKCDFNLLQALTLDQSLITNALNIIFNANYDVDEALFTGITQSILCSEIGWRVFTTSLKIIVAITDAKTKSYLDSYNQGILTPFNMTCQLKDTCFIANTDYPSEYQIRELLQSNDIELIILPTTNVLGYYNAFKSYFYEINPQVASLSDESTVIQLLEDTILRATRTVTFNVVNPIDGVKVEFATNCIKQTGTPENAVSCEISKGESFELSVNVTLTKCLANEEKLIKINLRNVGIVTIAIDTLCECVCSDQVSESPATDICNSNGILVCGVCVCDPQWTGEKCDCSTNTDNCVSPTDVKRLTCSTHGECSCNKCECDTIPKTDTKYFGDYCECGYTNCILTDKGYCGGPDQGACECNDCKCRPEYDTLNCLQPNCDDAFWMNKCKSDENASVCSNLGTCNCGICECSTSYIGEFCEQSIGCEAHDFCASCYILSLSSQVSDECKTCTQYKVIKLPDDQYPKEHTCAKKIGQCYYFYDVRVDGDNFNIFVYADSKIICPKPPNIPAIIGGIIASIVVVGLLITFIYLLIKYLHDKAEYKKFQKLKAAKGEVAHNPLYEGDPV